MQTLLTISLKGERGNEIYNRGVYNNQYNTEASLKVTTKYVLYVISYIYYKKINNNNKNIFSECLDKTQTIKKKTMVDRDEEEEKNSEASKAIRRRNAELFGESYDEMS